MLIVTSGWTRMRGKKARSPVSLGVGSKRSEQLCRRNWAEMTLAGVGLVENTNTAI